MSRRSKVSRRRFVREGVGTAVVASFLTPQDLFGGKAPLTDAAITEHFARLRGTDQYASELAEAKNLGAFLRARFDLTRQQMKNLESLPAESLRSLAPALDRAAAEEMSIKVVGAKGECSGLRSRFAGDTLFIEVLSNRPPISDAGVNAHFDRLQGTPQFASEVAAAKADLPAYLGKHFSLTPVQVQNIRRLPQRNLVELRSALDRAVSDDLAIRLEGVAKQECARVEPIFSSGVLTIKVR